MCSRCLLAVRGAISSRSAMPYVVWPSASRTSTASSVAVRPMRSAEAHDWRPHGALGRHGRELEEQAAEQALQVTGEGQLVVVELVAAPAEDEGLVREAVECVGDRQLLFPVVGPQQLLDAAPVASR